MTPLKTKNNTTRVISKSVLLRKQRTISRKLRREFSLNSVISNLETRIQDLSTKSDFQSRCQKAMLEVQLTNRRGQLNRMLARIEREEQALFAQITSNLKIAEERARIKRAI